MGIFGPPGVEDLGAAPPRRARVGGTIKLINKVSHRPIWVEVIDVSSLGSRRVRVVASTVVPRGRAVRVSVPPGRYGFRYRVNYAMGLNRRSPGAIIGTDEHRTVILRK